YIISLIAPFSPSCLKLKGKHQQALHISQKLDLKVQHSLTKKNKTGFVEFIKIVIKQKYYLSVILISLMAVLNGFGGINVFIS
ncbi:MFS transporter, partial [Francisella tularensis subsp. holarctica]|nr:MFS transporter [Francisella tularensis subsp. holarctica]